MPFWFLRVSLSLATAQKGCHICHSFVWMIYILRHQRFLCPCMFRHLNKYHNVICRRDLSFLYVNYYSRRVSKHMDTNLWYGYSWTALHCTAKFTCVYEFEHMVDFLFPINYCKDKTQKSKGVAITETELWIQASVYKSLFLLWKIMMKNCWIFNFRENILRISCKFSGSIVSYVVFS